MAILGFQLDTVGEVGVIPRLIKLNTNETIADVTTAGFLNIFVAQGNSLNETDMALVVTQASSSVAPVSSFYNVSFSSGNWSLVAI